MLELTKRQRAGIADRINRIRAYCDDACHELVDGGLAPGKAEAREPKVAVREHVAKIRAECDALIKACDRYQVMQSLKRQEGREC